MRKLIFVLFSVCVFSVGSFAKNVNGIEFLDLTNVAGKNLVLNGVGERLATIFKVRVYTAALYLAEKNSDAEAILASQESKAVVMVFNRDVKRSDIQDAYHEGFKKNCEEALVQGELKPLIEGLTAVFQDLKKGDKLSYFFTGTAFELQKGGESLYKSSNSKFTKCVLSTWIGKRPPNESLKEGLLGLKP